MENNENITEQQYDTNAHYLINTTWGYTINTIHKVNKCSINVGGTNIRKEEFNKICYKLTDEEWELYKHELIKNLQLPMDIIKKFNNIIFNLQKSLDYCKGLVNVNEEGINDLIDTLVKDIKEQLPSNIKINNETYKFKNDKYSFLVRE